MVAKIKSGKSLIGALNYNENKVRDQKAELIMTSGYFKESFELSFRDKLLRLEDLAERNQRTKVNTVHISLNFANEDNIENDKLQQICCDYLQQIGFGNQPCLVYRHMDAGHAHIHIVTTNIQITGERISLHMLGKTKSEAARKAIELKYGLIQADGRNSQTERPERTALRKVDYGKAETKRAITNVVNEVVRSYKFTSLPELNAVLNQFGVIPDRGAMDSRMYEKQGLLYWLTGADNEKTGVPIKASSIYGKPTLRVLEDRFKLNGVLRKRFREPLRQLVDQTLSKPLSKIQFQKELEQKGVQVIFRRNEEGRTYGVTFIDHHSKSVFNGSDLGRQYSAGKLMSRFADRDSAPLQEPVNSRFHPGKTEVPAPDNYNNIAQQPAGGYVLEALFEEERQDLAALGIF